MQVNILISFLCNNISFKIILSIQMFSSSMIFQVFYINGCKLTFTLGCHWLKNILTIPKLCKNLFNHTTSYIITEQIVNSASMVDKAIQVCFLLFHKLTSLLSKNVYLDVDLCSSRSPTQMACEQPTSTIICLDHKMNNP